ncbi:MAG: PDZ domain-containing protein [Bacteroidales bacterium]|nr:PDZ domain-containing protein [Bacteroidales bacterium]
MNNRSPISSAYFFYPEKNLLLLVTLALFSLNLSAQYSSFTIDNQSNRKCFNFELINNLIVVPVVINDSIQANFILDTGVRSTILTDNTQTNFDLSTCRPVQIIGAGIMNEVEAFVVPNIRFTLPGITADRLSIVVLKEDYLHLQNHLGIEINGILGYDFFSQFVVKIDYEGKIITVFNPDNFRLRKSYSQENISIIQGRPYIDTRVTLQNGSKLNAKLLIDTGASHAIMLETDSDSTIYVPDKHIETIVGWGLGGELTGELGRIDSLNIKGYSFENVLCTFVSDYGQHIIDKIPDRKGSVGGELLAKFTTIIDYKNKKLYLRKNTRFKSDFVYNMSGIDLIAIGNDFKLFKVIHLIKGSPADIAGVQIGDMILAINGQMITEMTIQEVNGFFRTKPKNRVSLLILRDQSLVKLSFKLAKLV